MKKVFISQPMNGKTPKEINNEREQVIKELEKLHPDENIIILESRINDVELAPNMNKDLWMLSKSIEIMAQADVVYFAPGWKETRGCRIEYNCATGYGLEVWM